MSINISISIISYIPSARILKLCMIQTDIYYMIYRDKNYQKIKTLIKYDPELVFILNKDILIDYIKELSNDSVDFSEFLFDFAGSARHYLYNHPEQLIYLMADRNLLKTLVAEFDSFDKFIDKFGDGYINVVFYSPINLQKKIENNMITFQISIQADYDDKFLGLVNSLLLYL